jgi:hypothetical protein
VKDIIELVDDNIDRDPKFLLCSKASEANPEVVWSCVWSCAHDYIVLFN